MFQSLENRSLKSSNRWKFFAVLFPIIGTCAMAQGPGSLTGFFQAWWGASSGFSPSQLPNLVLWLDANDSATLFNATTGGSASTNDGAVARWEDKSGNATHFTQATTNARPTRKVANRNARDTVRFDGGDDLINTNAIIMTTNQPMTMYIVAGYATNTSPTYPTVVTLRSEGANAWVLAGSPITDTSYRHHYFGSGGAPWYNGRIGVSDMRGNYWNYRFVYQGSNAGSSTGMVVYLNNVLQTVNNAGAFSGQGNARNVLGQFGSSADATLRLLGDIAEVIIYREQHTADQQARVNDYLEQKWGF